MALQQTHPRKIVDDLLMLRTNISKQLRNCRIVLTKPNIGHDNGKANLTIRNVNKFRIRMN